MSPIMRERAGADRGSSTIEYVALLLIVALVVAAATVTIPNPVGDNMKVALCRIFNAISGGHGSCRPSSVNYKPSACTVSTSTNSYGGSVDVAFFQVGKDLIFIKAKDSQGNVTITAVNGTSGGVGTGVGIGINAGNVVNIGADATADANLKIGIGNSWVFPNEQAADKYIGAVREQAIIDGVKDTSALGWLGGTIYDKVAGPDLRDPDIDRYEVSVNGNAGVSGGLQVGPGQATGKHAKSADKGSKYDKRGGDVNLKPNLSADLSINAAEKAIIEKNHKDGTTAVTYSLTGGVTANGNYVAGGKQGRANTTGAMKVSYKDGHIVGVDLTATRIVNGKATVTTNHLAVDNAADEAIVRDYLLGGGATPSTLGLTIDDLAPTEAPGQGSSPLQRLLYEKAQVQKVDYAYEAGARSYGASVKLGMKLGLGVNLSSSAQQVTGAQYLGAPGADGVRHYENFLECHQ
jgi:hypothetical protein